MEIPSSHCNSDCWCVRIGVRRRQQGGFYDRSSMFDWAKFAVARLGKYGGRVSNLSSAILVADSLGDKLTSLQTGS